jgi:preprotein translocase subunit SecD
MGRAALLAIFSVCCSVGTGSAQVTFALRMVVPCDARNASLPMNVEGEGGKFCMQQEAIVDQADVKLAEVASEPNGPRVRLTLTDAGSRKLLDTTRKNIGNRIGVVLNGRLLSAPIVRAPISNGIPISGHFTEQERNDIVAAFNRQAGQH